MNWVITISPGEIIVLGLIALVIVGACVVAVIDAAVSLVERIKKKR